MPENKHGPTPGVNVEELPALAPSIIGVDTSVPVFIGYTETAHDPVSDKSLMLQPVLITSLADYTSLFGGRHRDTYDIVSKSDATHADFQALFSSGDVVASQWFAIQGANGKPAGARYNLYVALCLFFANGGGTCYVVSVGPYGGTLVTMPDLLAGIGVSASQIGPSMLVVPDACLLPGTGAGSDYAAVAVAMLRSAATAQDRVAILDLPGALDPASWTTVGLAACRDAFYEAIAPASAAFSYGAAYAPALDVAVLPLSDVTYLDLRGSEPSTAIVENLLTTQARSMYGANPAQLKAVTDHIAQAFGPGSAPVSPDATLNQYLLSTIPLFGQIIQVLVGKLNVAPPSGIMAGVWAANDLQHGVWKAPANIALNSTVQPTVTLTDHDQAAYNTPLNGIAVDILRSFPGRGTVVWGARTLDGNSQDYRYVQVRRTIVFIEQSVKAALQPLVFEANDGRTWATVTSMVSTFLTDLWRNGGLQGSTPRDAFSVQCGLGSTMTAQDILDGRLVVNIEVAMIRPAEFIVMRIVQLMPAG